MVFSFNSVQFLFFIVILSVSMYSCKNESNKDMFFTTEVLITSESGKKLEKQENIEFQYGKPTSNIIRIYPEIKKQRIFGIGSSFTESSAFVLAHLTDSSRKGLMNIIFGKDGANFSMARTHIGACDFCVEGKYSYADLPNDTALNSFSIDCDSEGFSKEKYPYIENENYDLLHMIKEALAIKKSQSDKDLRIVASAWTAPKWMKDIEEWYIPGSEENNWNGTGGKLKDEYRSTYADYLMKYLYAYKDQGIDIWGLTPVNEPHGNNGNWESMHFTPETQNEFIKQYLGPRLKSSSFKDIYLLIYDQNRADMERWADVIFSDPETAMYVNGIAVHWYESTFKVYEDLFEKVHQKYPKYSIIHTEGCIDDLGKKAPNGIIDTDKFQEENWFKNDSFWWNKNATDWAYTAEWAQNREDHPIYTPVHRYARDIIVGFDHWLEGWIDWNIILDKNGGPNHVGNFCGAPIMIDTETKELYFTPVYYILAQFSRTIRPGDTAVQTEKKLEDQGNDDLHCCATINKDGLLSVQVLNTTKKLMNYCLQIGEQYAKIEIPANSLQTVRIQLW
jgi:glucosylceramidase